MPNPLTGDFEAVLQVSLRQVNGLLAAVHQNRIDPARSPSFMHSATFRVGREFLTSVDEFVRIKGWAIKAVAATAVPSGAATMAQVLSHQPPAGLAPYFHESLQQLAYGFEHIDSSQTRGLAEVQLSNPTIAFAPNAVSRVLVDVVLRARYLPDSGTGALPEPVHGTLRTQYTIVPATLPDGRRVLRIALTPQDADIVFTPLPGTLGPAATTTVTAQIRKSLRRHFAPMDFTLPGDFSLSAMKSVGAGANEAVAFPLALSSGAPVGNIASITAELLGGHEFGIAVAREFVEAQFGPFLQTVKERVLTIKTFLADYTVIVSSLTIEWHPGYLNLNGHVTLTTDSILPNGYIDFKQRLEMKLDAPSQTVSLVAVGEPWVDESWFVPHDRAVSEVKTARDLGLPSASAALHAQAIGARDKLVRAIKTFDIFGDARLSQVEVTPHGLILRGSVRSSSRNAPVVHIGETDGGASLTAFHSWVPGGRIDEFVWSWVEKTHLIPWFNKTTSVTQRHHFVFGKPPAFSKLSRVCLLLRGTRLNENGYAESVSAGEVCRVSAHEPVLVVPPWWTKVMMPIWWPDPPDDAIELGISAHVNMVSDRAENRPRYNTLVHFAGQEWRQPLAFLANALGYVTRWDRSLVVMLVLPTGALTGPRRGIEERLGPVGDRFGADLQITEDYAGGWTRTFAPERDAASFLVNAHGQVAWRHDGLAEPERLARAIDEHTVPAPDPRIEFVATRVKAGDAAPDAEFDDGQGNRTSLRRLRGRRVLLTFWQSWSTPCHAELRRIERLNHEGNRHDVIAVNGGETDEVIASTRAALGLSFPLIRDPQQTIAELYGIRCWPTTVVINEWGFIDRIQSGSAPRWREPREQDDLTSSA